MESVSRQTYCLEKERIEREWSAPITVLELPTKQSAGRPASEFESLALRHSWQILGCVQQT